MLLSILENAENIIRNFKEDLCVHLDPEVIRKKIE
jgi:hypothetical protein